MIRELKRFFTIPTRIPLSYFDLPPPKIPLPTSFDQLDKEFISFFLLDPTIYEIKPIINNLRTKYFFKLLPHNFFKPKNLLPHDPHTIKEKLTSLQFSIPTTNTHDTLQLINFLKKDYRLFLPLGPQCQSRRSADLAGVF